MDCFRPQQWKMSLNRALFEASELSLDEMAKIVEFVAHETRHAEQVYLMARWRASQGWTAKMIADRLDIPLDIARKARRNALRSRSPKWMSKLAERVYESAHGEHKMNRFLVLSELEEANKNYRKTQNALKELLSNSDSDPAKIEVAREYFENAKKVCQERYGKYREFAEEQDAWKIGQEAGRIFKESMENADHLRSQITWARYDVKGLEEQVRLAKETWQQKMRGLKTLRKIKVSSERIAAMENLVHSAHNEMLQYARDLKKRRGYLNELQKKLKTVWSGKD